MTAVDLDVTYRILDAAGVETLALTEDAGYILRNEMSPAGRSWRTIDVTSPYVDGDHTTQAVLEAQELVIALRVVGATAGQMERRRQALEQAVSEQLWYIAETVEGTVTTWRCKRPADTTWSLSTYDLISHSRVGTVRARVQPTPEQTIGA